MAEDRTPGPADQPEDDKPQPRDKPSEPYRLGGSGGSGKSPQGPSGKSGGEPDNPFEAFFSSLAGGDMNALAAQLQSAFAMLGGAGSMFTSGPTEAGSGVNWEVTKNTARKTVASLGPDPAPDAGHQRAVTEAVELAEVWLDQATTFPRVSTSVAAWSRAEWIEQTMPVWRRLVEPVALHIADAMEGALNFGATEETAGLPGMAGMEQMLRPMLRTSGASMFGLQLGQGLGQLATEVVGATDIGLPLSEPGRVALLPTNIKVFGEGLEQPSSDVTLYLALRECARQRLFASAGWLRAQMLTLVEQYASGITIDTSALEQAVGQLDASNLEELSSSLEGGLFEPQKTPEQLATLERLETMLALVEGWVDEVVTQATAQWMPSAPALAEAVRRARATGGPAEETFATLVGLELRPRRMRDAANLWAALRDARGADGRDTVWSHPDLVPTSADLDDPLGFVAGDARSDSQENPDFDAALEELLKGEGSEGEGSEGGENPSS
ncbi:MAG TPA: zinc-dependent metalloprotease [Propionibacteriaceae bacterium]